MAGGIDALVANAKEAFDAGDYRWAAEVGNHAVFAEPDHAAAREVLADTYEQLGYGSENGTWRDFYLSGATELREGKFGTPTKTDSPDVVRQLTPEMVFDALAIQVNGPKAWDEKILIDVAVTDLDTQYRLRLANGVLTYSAAPQREQADMTITGKKSALPALAAGSKEAIIAAGLDLNGDTDALARLNAVLESGDSDFNIVTP